MAKRPPARASHPRLREALAWLEAHATAHTRTGLARYGIVTADRVLGVSMKDTQTLGKALGRDHALAEALWCTGVFDARMLAAFVDEPALVTAAQMDRWCRQFDNWAYPDTLGFHLFDRTPYAWGRIDAWSRRRAQFEKRAAFALLWSTALHDKGRADTPYRHGLQLVEQAAADERPFVKKAVSMALKAVGRRGPALRAAAIDVARRLAAAPEPAPRWVGRDALATLAHVKARR